jgi:hypothetical protein
MKKEVILVILAVLLVSCTSRFPEVMTGADFRAPAAPCISTGTDFYKAGYARDYSTIRYDYCVGDKTLFKAVCVNMQQSGHFAHECEKGCFNGACIR